MKLPIRLQAGRHSHWFDADEYALGENWHEPFGPLVVKSVNCHEKMLAALKATEAFWMACAKAWHENDGVILEESTTGGGVVVGNNIDVLADIAAPLVHAAIKMAES